MADPRPGLIAAIRNHPGDDTARHVYADWCEEAGDLPRAEFIRAQIEVERLSPRHPRRGELLNRAETLLARHEAEWLGPWANRLVRWSFRRGFLHAATLTDAAFLEHGEALFREHPIPRIGFVDAVGEPLGEAAVRAVVQNRTFRHVRSLDILGVVPGELRSMYWHVPFNQPSVPIEVWLEALATTPHVRLREFRPGSRFRRRVTSGIPLELLQAFCRAPHLRTLRSLDLADRAVAIRTPSQEQLVEVLAGASFAAGLRRLILRGWSLPEGSLTPLGVAFPQMRHLVLPFDRLADADLADLLRAPGLANLTGFEASVETLPVLAAAPPAARLRHLTVLDTDRDPETRAETQAAWARLLELAPPLRELHLVCHDPGRDALAAMRHSRALRGVHTLILQNDSQSDGIFRLRGVARLLRSGAMPHLRRLHLHEFATAEFLESLRGWRGLARLESLVATDDYFGRVVPTRHPDYPLGPHLTDLRGVRITTVADLEALRAWPCFPALRSLGLLFYAPIARGDLERFFRQPAIQRLEFLRITYQTSRGGVGAIPAEVADILSDAGVLPRLTTLWIPHDNDATRVTGLRARFGARLKV